MKPISLEIEAFGAFAKKQSVDFKRFEQNRLFLIHGPTGAGKTTLFDAICYALYGETTGNRKGENMRSDHVEGDTPSMVSFIFQLGLHYYKVERKLSVTKSGNLTDHQVFGEVTWDEEKKEFIDSSNPITKKREIVDKVVSLLGFNADQFKQIVILPQGKFQELLLSDTNKKEEILTQLFNARIYEHITQKLLEAAKNQKKSIKEKQDKIHARLDSVGKESIENLELQISEYENNLVQLREQLPLMEAAYKKSHDDFQELIQLHKEYQEYEEAKSALQTHLAKSETILNKEENKVKAERAEYLRPVIRAEIEAGKEVEEKIGQIRTQKSIWITVENKLKSAQKTWDESQKFKTKIEENKAKINHLKELQPKFIELDKLKESFNLHKTGFEELKKQLSQKEGEIETNNKAISGFEAELDKLNTILMQQSGLEQKVKELDEKIKLRKELKQARTEYSAENQKRNKVLDELNVIGEERAKKSTHYDTLEKQWRLSQSALLAEKLVLDQPCPVCGSLEHPNPAQKTSEFVSNEELEIAKKSRDESEKLYDGKQVIFNELDKKVVLLKENGIHLANRLGDWANLDDTEFKNQTEKIKKDFEEGQKAEKRNLELKAQIQNLKKQILETESSLKQLREKRDDSQKNYLQAEERIKNTESSLPKDLHSEQELEDVLENLTEENEDLAEKIEDADKKKEEAKEALTKIETAIKSDEKLLKKLESDWEDKQKELQRRLKDRGFKTAEEVKEALLPEDEKTSLDKEIADWKTEKTRIETRLKKAEDKINDREKPELLRREEEVKQKDQELIAHRERITEENSRKESLKNQLDEIQKLHKELEKLEKEAQHAIELADLANGGNELNQRFQTYVLSVFLDEVVDYANKRLRILSQDRYQLNRTEEILHGNRKAGLDLKVFDSYSGKERLVHNLSGGETFFTSLALALGLADVATANAGGIRLDAMFIDEGFGTLDSETLDLAIKTLMNLDGEYRLVGIISHVAELKERIPSNRLEVVKGRNGSTLKVHAN